MLISIWCEDTKLIRYLLNIGLKKYNLYQVFPSPDVFCFIYLSLFLADIITVLMYNCMIWNVACTIWMPAFPIPVLLILFLGLMMVSSSSVLVCWSFFLLCVCCAWACCLLFRLTSSVALAPCLLTIAALAFSLAVLTAASTALLVALLLLGSILRCFA